MKWFGHAIKAYNDGRPDFYKEKFTPYRYGVGVANFAFLPPTYEIPYDIVGNGFKTHHQPPATFQPQQVYSLPISTTVGLGGLVAGQLALQGLIVPAEAQGSTLL